MSTGRSQPLSAAHTATPEPFREPVEWRYLVTSGEASLGGESAARAGFGLGLGGETPSCICCGMARGEALAAGNGCRRDAKSHCGM